MKQLYQGLLINNQSRRQIQQEKIAAKALSLRLSNWNTIIKTKNFRINKEETVLFYLVDDFLDYYDKPFKIPQTQGNEREQVWLGRAHNPVQQDKQPFQPISNSKYLSRYHMKIIYDKEMQAYWIQDLLTQFPVFMILSHNQPIQLKQGMIIQGGMQKQDEEPTQFYIDKLTSQPENFRDYTQKNEELQRFFMPKNCKVDKFNNLVKKAYLRTIIDDDTNKTCFECTTDKDRDTWLVVSKGLRIKQLKQAGMATWKFKEMKKNDRVLTIPNNAPGYWGTITYERDTGWYMQATEWGERECNCLKILLKNKSQRRQYDDGQSVSDPILIQDGMKFGIADDLFFQCNTETELKYTKEFLQQIQSEQQTEEGNDVEDDEEELI